MPPAFLLVFAQVDCRRTGMWRGEKELQAFHASLLGVGIIASFSSLSSMATYLYIGFMWCDVWVTIQDGKKYAYQGNKFSEGSDEATLP